MTLLDMNICTVEDVEVVHSSMLQMTEKLKHRFEEEVEHMDVCLFYYIYFHHSLGLVCSSCTPMYNALCIIGH